MCPDAEVLLLPLEELRVFASYLRSMDVTNFIWYKFKFDLPQKLSKSTQRQSLQPFAAVALEKSEDRSSKSQVTSTLQL
jgi:hypothetical protein